MLNASLSDNANISHEKKKLKADIQFLYFENCKIIPCFSKIHISSTVLNLQSQHNRQAITNKLSHFCQKKKYM